MARVRLEGVKKAYDDGVIAVHDVSLDVADGEFVVLVGPSGCGKSTTLRMIAGLESITAGELLIDERVVNDLSPAERDIAMVFQSYALYPHMTVRQNMGFALRLQKRPRAEIERRVGEAAALLGLSELLDRAPRQLSGGQRQRVAIGRALVREPRVFLFDEPLSNLDAKLRGEMRREIAALHRRLGATMIYVTHDQLEAMTLGDRIVVMNEGRVRQIGVPSEVYDHPRDTFVATFLGSPPMNLVPGTVGDSDGSLVFRPDAQPNAAVPLVLPTGAPGSASVAPAGTPVLLGVRPEHVRLADPASDGAPAHFPRATVELVEPLGHDQLVHLRLGDLMLAARTARYPTPAADSSVALVFDPAYVHLFDAVTGLALGSGATLNPSGTEIANH